MCGRFSITSPPEAMRQLFGYPQSPNFPPRYNIAPTQAIPIIRADGPLRQFALVRWGLVPSWFKEMGAKPLINARAETVVEKPSFRAAMRRRRCLIPADGFYEWERQASGPAQPYFIRQKTGGLFAMAGIWEHWLDSAGNELETAAIITTAANAVLQPFHHRMPCLIAPEHYGAWLDTKAIDPRTAQEFLMPADDDLLSAHKVSTRVNRVANDSPDLQTPLAIPPEPETTAKLL
ncbi:MAG: SOS response-associated peptidase [Alphaproteobacteria bacterium]